MRSLLKLSLASLAAVALFAGMALAQTTPKFSGNVGAGFGELMLGDTDASKGSKTGYSTFETSWESNLRMTMETDKLTAIVRYRARADNFQSSTTSAGNTTAFSSSSNDIYHEGWWKASDAFSLGIGKFQGQAWSQPISGAYLIKNPIGDGVYWMNWTGVAGIDAEFNAGVVQVGAAISSACKPSCNSAEGTSVAIASQSIVPHLTGKFGDIGLRAQLPQTTGTYGCTAATANTDCKKATDQYTSSGAGYQVGVSWAGMQGVFVGLDVSGFTEGKNKVQAQDRARAGMGLRADFAGVMIHYFSLTDSTYVKDSETTSSEITVRYTIPMGTGAVIPEYRTFTADDKSGAAKDKNGKAIALTNSILRLIYNVNY